MDAGAITSERALTHPQRHMITKALGFGDRGAPDLELLSVVPGQRFLVCFDGLTGDVSDGRIAELMAADVDEETLAEQLVTEAVEAVAQDNVTVVVLRVAGDGHGPDDRLDQATIPHMLPPPVTTGSGPDA